MTPLEKLIVRGMHGFFPASDAEILEAIIRGQINGELVLFHLETAAFCIVAMPKSPLDIPQVLHFYSEKPALRGALVAQVLDFVKLKGYNKLQAINGSGMDDTVWKRAFKHEGWDIKAVKTVFEFEVIK